MATKMNGSNPTQLSASKYRLGVDIGGTFTDVALESSGRRFTSKVLTTSAPERGVLLAIRAVLADAALTPAALSIIVHGTTLATNALIERKGVPATDHRAATRQAQSGAIERPRIG